MIFPMLRSRWIAMSVGAAIMLAPTIALAHAVVYPKKSATGAYEKYLLRIPNEKDVPTTRVEIRFPAGLRVVAFEDVPGWQLQVITDSAKAIIGAVWTGSLPAQRFVEFPFEAANPKVAGRLPWLTYQTYSNGERVEWTGPEHSKTPASITTIETPSVVASLGVSPWFSIAALVLAFISVGLVMRRPASVTAA
jgi:uncharacterized protein YcnI